MNNIITFHGLKKFPCDKSIRTTDALETEPEKETAARLAFIKHRGGIMLLTGEPGVGKTLAIRKFCDGLNENIFKAVYTPLSTLRGTDLLRHISQRLGLINRASKAAVYSQIQEEILDSKEQRGRTIVLIIDEAHLLSISSLQELRLLTNFKMDSFDPFILILAGQTELRKTMDLGVMEAFAQRIALRCTMPPLNQSQTTDYIQQHLKLAGAPDPIFTSAALAAIYEISLGIPRRIGLTVESALTIAMLENKKSIDAELILRAKIFG